MVALPNSWADIESDITYQTTSDLLVSFSQEQIKLDLKAIEKGQVPPRANTGLVASQEEGYDLKSKVLGKGGDRRFHAKFIVSSRV
ncbi:hypothetical protein LC653_04825 [Nostoc sp. CHAB 5784]|uniref:hypothetical protein n=1 Tax=Nostoc mirabile TaxID=2907820 RepID=UPI001E60B9DA|nr:hypothetical protein [Nostoc mirabile]MCC5663272.1 hypothetical protein [Nostoc mirabile CHAB5784]